MTFAVEQMGKSPTHKKGLPVLGSALAFANPNGVSVEFLQQGMRQYGDVFHFNVMKRSFYMVSSPDLVHEIFLERVQEFYKPEAMPGETNGLKLFLGNGVLTAGLEEWRPQRKLIQPLMQPRQIGEYADTIAGMGERLLERWQPGIQRDIHADMTQVTMWVIAEIMFGISVDQSKELEDIGREAQKIVVQRLVSPWPAWLTGQDSKVAHINQTLTRLVKRFIAERNAQGDPGRRDLLSILMATRDEDGNPISEGFLRDNILTMFFAGHETTANTLTWALYYLSQEPEILARLQQEVDTVLEGGRLPTLADLPQLPYTLMVIKETMRIQPTVPMIPRFILTDTTLGGYHLKANSFVLVSPYVLHHDERRWAAPEVFDPLRFSEENEKKIGRYSYFPFGGGPRICIGNHFALMEGQILLALIIRRFNLRLAPGTQVIPVRRVTCSPRDGLPMMVEPRISA